MKKRNPSSSPGHRSETVDRLALENRLSFSVHDLSSYINWIYFFHAWGFRPCYAAMADIHGCDACRVSWLTAFPEEGRSRASEAIQLYKETNRMLDKLDRDFGMENILKLCPANANGDSLIIDDITFPLLRQQVKKKENEPFLCLSDFVRPLTSGITDTVEVLASSINTDMEGLYEQDPYKHLLVQTLSDRLAETATEKVHKYVRREVWGYTKDENLSTLNLLVKEYQGIRPTVGYPSPPDQSVNFILDEILDMKQIGVRLTENGAMYPHALVCGLVFAHPASYYSSVGKIGEDQLADYATRRGESVGEMRKFLATDLQQIFSFDMFVTDPIL